MRITREKIQPLSRNTPLFKKLLIREGNAQPINQWSPKNLSPVDYSVYAFIK